MSLDADIDLSGSLSLSLGKVDASLNKLSKKIDDQVRLAAYPRQLPIFGQATANGIVDVAGFGPQNGRFWQCRLFGVMALVSNTFTPLPTNVPVSASGSFAGAAAGAVSLPAGASISEFTLTFAAGTATDYAVTVTNAAGGTLTYNVQVPATGLQFTVPYNPALLAATPGSQITVNVPAVAGGPAYSIDVAGVQPTAAPVVTLYAGQPVGTVGLPTGMLPAGQARWQFATLPGWENFSGDQARVQFGERLLVGITGLAAGVTLAINFVINDIPMDRGEAITIGA